jgi:hypothetical protein
MTKQEGLRYLRVAAVASLLTAAIFVFIDRRADDGNVPTPVLVANQLIPEGTPGNLVQSKRMYQPTAYPRSAVADGAISNPSYLSGRRAAENIYPGEQLTEDLWP